MGHGGKYYSLVRALLSQRVLYEAFQTREAQQGAAGIDGAGLNAFEANLEVELSALLSE